MASTEEDTTVNCTTFSTTLDTSTSRMDITREELEKRQLMHKIEILKLELSQKTQHFETLQNEHNIQVEELKEELREALHQRKMLHLKLKSSTHFHEQEVIHLKQRVRDVERQREEDEEGWRRRSREEEEGGGKGGGGGEEVRELVESALHLPPLSEDEYVSLRGEERGVGGGGEHHPPLIDYIRIRLYEMMEPLHQTIAGLRDVVADLTSQLTDTKNDQHTTHKTVDALKSRLASSEDHCEQLVRQLNQVTSQVQNGHYKITNFDQLASERDGLKSEVAQMRRAADQLNSLLQTTTRERDSSQREVQLLQQKTNLLLQDKEYLSQQVSELGGRVGAAEGREEALARKLAESLTAKDALYQESIQTREKERREAEEKLLRELERLREQSRLELQQTKSYTKEIFDRENRTLLESYHQLSDERDRAIEKERENGRKYEQLLQDHQKLQSRMETRVCELQATLQVKVFECQQMQRNKEITSRELREAKLMNITLQKKVEVLREEVRRERSESGEKVKELERKVEELTERLSVYQKLETELDDVVIQAAQAETESDAERILLSYGFGARLPTSTRARAQQSVRMAQRVLQLERINRALQRDSESERTLSQKLKEELADLRAVLSTTHQPQSYMIQSLRRLQNEARTLRDTVADLQKELERCKEENKQLQDVRSKMACDIETLLCHRQELSRMKELLLGPHCHPHHHEATPHPHHHITGFPLISSLGDDSYTPQPLLFTKGRHRTTTSVRPHPPLMNSHPTSIS